MSRTNECKEYMMKEKVLISIFFVAVFINYLGPIIDLDFPFHLKTGEYIYQHKGIPETDPFSFTGEGIATEREKFILSQYWLAQIIFYKVYSIAGPPGIVILRSMVFSSFFFLLWRSIRKRGFYSSLVITLLAAIVLLPSKLDRPQIFSFLFALILILLLEKFREDTDSAIPLYFIPPVMLLWANMHGGFVFGIAVIVIYTLAEAVKFFINKPDFIGIIGKPLKERSFLKLSAIALLAIFFSYINPDVNGQLLVTLESHTSTRWLFENIREYMSPLEEMRTPFAIRISSLFFWVLFGFICIIVALNMLRKKNMDMTAFILILFSSVAAFTSVRYIPFFLATALPLSRNYSFFNDKDFLRGMRRSQVVYAFTIVVFIFTIGLGLRGRHDMFSINRQVIYPEGAADFLIKNRIKANMFNSINRGSYLLWKLYPYYKVFNDSRSIYEKAVVDGDIIRNALDNDAQPPNFSLANAMSDLVPEELGRIGVSGLDLSKSSKSVKPLWKKLLDQYNIDLIVHEACADYSWGVYPLTLRLIKDEDWVLIYIDGTIQIFVRNKQKYSNVIKKYGKSKQLIYDEIILETIPFVQTKIPISTPYSSLAFALMMKGKEPDARKMVDAALAIDDNDLVANFCKAYLMLQQKAQERQAYKSKK